MILKAYPPRMTPEQFEEWDEETGFELIDGIVRESERGTESGSIGGRILYFLTAIVIKSRLGEVLNPNGLYQCFPQYPERVRKPDVSFIQQSRLPEGRVPRGICRVAPDLVVEVISPNDRYEDVEEKVADYLDAGVPLIWVVTPKTRTVLVYQNNGTATRLKDTDTITADPVIPGVSVLIADFFPNPRETPATDDTPAPAVS